MLVPDAGLVVVSVSVSVVLGPVVGSALAGGAVVEGGAASLAR